VELGCDIARTRAAEEGVGKQWFLTPLSATGVAQGIAYFDFGFVEPTQGAAIAKMAKDSQAAPKGLDGTLVTRVAMSVDVLARLHQQIQQVLVDLRDARQGPRNPIPVSSETGP
jgi:hypothetical protein